MSSSSSPGLWPAPKARARKATAVRTSYSSFKITNKVIQDKLSGTRNNLSTTNLVHIRRTRSRVTGLENTVVIMKVLSMP